MPIGELTRDPRNVRHHTDRNRAAVLHSIEKHGQVENLVVEAGTDPLRLIGGELRLDCMLELGIAEVQVCEVDVHDAQRDALAVLLNRAHELGGWRTEELAAMLDYLDDEGEDLALLGFDGDDLAYLEEFLAATEADEDLGPGDGSDFPFVEPDDDDGGLDGYDSQPGKTYEVGGNSIRCAIPATCDQLRRLFTTWALTHDQDPGTGALE